MDNYLTDADKNIVFLIKTMNSEFLENTLKNGTFCFNKPSAFNNTNNKLSEQQDTWDSYLTYTALGTFFAPIKKEDSDGIIYEKGCKLSDNSIVRQITNIEKSSYICCFRKVEEKDFIEAYGAKVLRLEDTIDKIKNGFNHDSFILIFKPLELLERINRKYRFYARSITYGEIDEDYQYYLDNNNFPQKNMFQKRERYEYQNEFRIIIPPKNDSERLIFDIGSIEDIAIGGNLELLRNGFVFGDTEEQVQKALEIIEREGIKQ